MEEIKADKVIDARGSYCPGPLMELIKSIRGEAVGAILEVLSSDKGSAKDIPEWLQKAGHEHLATIQEDNYWRIFVRKAR